MGSVITASLKVVSNRKKYGSCSVDGILSALETRCLVTGSPASVVSAVTLGGKLRALLSADGVTQTHSILNSESRVRIIMCPFGINENQL